MASPSRNIASVVVVVVLILPIMYYVVFGQNSKAGKDGLPVVGEWTVDAVTLDSISHKIPPFEFTDQHNAPFSSEQLKGKVYVAYFFFTSCPSICYQLSRQMKRVQVMTKDVEDFEIISFTVDPERDTPEKLLKYARRIGSELINWHFLTGEEEIIYDLGWNGFLVGMGKDNESPGGFIHSERFILVDKEGQIRGMYDGTDAAAVAVMVDDIKWLEESYDQPAKITE